MVTAKRQNDGRKVQTLSTARRPRSVKRRPRKAWRGVRSQEGETSSGRATSQGGLTSQGEPLQCHRHQQSPLPPTRRRTFHCVLHLGAESLRVTRFVPFQSSQYIQRFEFIRILRSTGHFSWDTEIDTKPKCKVNMDSY